MEFSRLRNRMTAKPKAARSLAACRPDPAQSRSIPNLFSLREVIAGAACDRLCA